MESTTLDFFLFFENSTQPLKVDQRTLTNWVVPFAINILLMILTLWILIALIHYGIVTGKWRQTQTSKAELLNVGRIYSTVVVCAVACFCYYLTNLIYLNIGYDPGQDNLCDSVGDAAVSIYGIILFTGSMFYWLRQRVFFSNNMLNTNYSKVVQLLSVTSIAMVIGGGLVVLVINCLPDNRSSSPEGCTFMPREENRTSYWIPILSIIFLAQIMLLGLLVYALIKTNKKKMRSSSKLRSSQIHVNAKTVNSVESGNSGKSRSTVKKRKSSRHTVRSILQKTLLFAILSFLAEIFNQMFIHYIASSTGHRRYVTTFTNITAFFNLIFIIMSFLQYKKILTSPFKTLCK